MSKKNRAISKTGGRPAIAKAYIFPLNGGEPQLAAGSSKAIDALVKAYNTPLGPSTGNETTPSESEA